MPRLPSSAPSLRPALFALLLGLPFAAMAAEAPKQPVAAADPVVIKINTIEVKRSEIAALQKSLGPRAASLSLDQFYQRFADQVIATKLVGEAAKAAKLDADPEVKTELDKAKEQILTSVYVKHLRAKAVTDDAIKAFYEKSVKTEPGKPEIHARQILVKTEDEAKAVIAELEKGADFAKLADEKAPDKAAKPDGAVGGDLGWLSKDQMPPEFSEAAFKLAKGEYTKEPVKTQFGFHVILVEDTRTAPPPTLDEAKEQIKGQVENEAIEAKIKELRDKAKVEQFALDGSPLPNPAAPPPSALPAAPGKPAAK